MNLQDKVISLELAKEIKQVAEEKGVELPESESLWVLNTSSSGKREAYTLKRGGLRFPLSRPAYDVAELGESLRCFTMDVTCFGPKQWCYLAEDKVVKTEAEARGRMLLYLLKNDLLK